MADGTVPSFMERNSDYGTEDEIRSQAAPQPAATQKKFDIGFDYAAESDVFPINKQKITRQPTVANIAQKAPQPSRSSKGAMLAAELSGLAMSSPPKPKPVLARQASVSVAVDGPRAPAAELSKEAGPFSKSRWFFENMDRAQFEKAVASCMQGDFLVRKSGSSNGYVLCVNDFHKPINFTISVESDGTLEFTGQRFRSLEDVIEYARKTPLKSRTAPGEQLRLGSPAVLQRWYPYGLSRERCEAAVAAGGHGSFLVRMSSSMDKFVLVVNDSNHVCSYTIVKTNTRYSFGGSVHDSMEQLIDHIRVKPFQSKVTQKLTLGNSAL